MGSGSTVMGSESMVMGSDSTVMGSDSTVMGSDAAVTGCGPAEPQDACCPSRGLQSDTQPTDRRTSMPSARAASPSVPF